MPRVDSKECPHWSVFTFRLSLLVTLDGRLGVGAASLQADRLVSSSLSSLENLSFLLFSTCIVSSSTFSRAQTPKIQSPQLVYRSLASARVMDKTPSCPEDVYFVFRVRVGSLTDGLLPVGRIEVSDRDGLRIASTFDSTFASTYGGSSISPQGLARKAMAACARASASISQLQSATRAAAVCARPCGRPLLLTPKMAMLRTAEAFSDEVRVS